MRAYYLQVIISHVKIDVLTYLLWSKYFGRFYTERNRGPANRANLYSTKCKNVEEQYTIYTYILCMREREREKTNLKEVKEKLYMYNNIKRIKKKLML